MGLEHGSGWAGGGAPLTQPDTALSGSAVRPKQITISESLRRACLAFKTSKVVWIK